MEQVKSEQMTEFNAGFRRLEATLHRPGVTETRREEVAEEMPVGLVYNESLYAVVMASPTDLEDFAYGFSLTEGIVETIADVYLAGIEPTGEDDGVQIFMAVPNERYGQLVAGRRNLTVGSSCGLCGTSSFAEALRPLPEVASRRTFSPEAVVRAMSGLVPLQPLNQRLGAVHAAGFALADGRVVAVREDIGRHNALDKLIGHILRGGIDPAEGFAVVSSRCSFEMVHKTAAAGIPLIATVSAPTTLAAEFAESVRVGMVAFAREDRFTVYAVPSRVAPAR
jgi:FdhD protein